MNNITPTKTGMSTTTNSDAGRLAPVTTTRHDARDHGTERVDGEPVAASRVGRSWSQCLTMPDWLMREVDEHAHRVQRDERMGVAAEGDDQQDGDTAQEHDARGECEAVAAERELARA